MPKQKIYISGKITGMEEAAKEIFENEETRLRKLYPDAEIVNPFKLNHNHDKSWEKYMKVCLTELCSCDTIVMLPNWKYSKGAIMELDVAIAIGLYIMM